MQENKLKQNSLFFRSDILIVLKMNTTSIFLPQSDRKSSVIAKCHIP